MLAMWGWRSKNDAIYFPGRLHDKDDLTQVIDARTAGV
jgi:hypothetical protein